MWNLNEEVHFQKESYPSASELHHSSIQHLKILSILFMNTFPPTFSAGELKKCCNFILCNQSFLKVTCHSFSSGRVEQNTDFLLFLNLLEAEPWRITFAFRCSRLSHESRHRLTYRAARRAAKLAALQMCSWSSNIHAVWGDAKYFHERCKILSRGRFRARSGGSGGEQTVHPSTHHLLFSGLMIIDLTPSQSFAIQTLVHSPLLFMCH